MKQRQPLKRKSPLKRSGRLKPASKKRAVQLHEYSRKRAVFLRERPLCQFCGGFSSDVHHTQGRRGAMLNDELTWMALCRPCHDMIHKNPKRSREEGYLK